MHASLYQLKKKLAPLLVAFLFVGTQVVSTSAIFLLNSGVANAAVACTNDQQGANDEPGQKDLTQMCSDTATSGSGYITVTWNWDDTAWSGNNSGDACALFDTDNDGKANYSLCAVVKGDPASIIDTRVYSCNDSRTDRCGTPTQDLTITSSCTTAITSTVPFGPGNDTKATCTIQLSDVGGVATTNLTDVCSYPSQQPNSDPSDCVVATTAKAGKLTVIKDLVPSSDSGKFDLLIDDSVYANSVGDNGTTGVIPVSDTTHKVSELAVAGTSLGDYNTTITCKDKAGKTVLGPVAGTSANVTVDDTGNDADITCVIKNTLKVGSITIKKDAIPNNAQNFDFTATGTGVADFTLDDDSGALGANSTYSNTNKFDNLKAGEYVITENDTNGWSLDGISCSAGSDVNKDGAKVTINLKAGQDVTCTYTNRQHGTITVQKVTDPADDKTSFDVKASGGTIYNGTDKSISTSQDAVYEVAQNGTYNIAEDQTAGWAETDNTCKDIKITYDKLNATCTITNTKYSKLTIIKDAVPNDPQDFLFYTDGLKPDQFSLDDDSDNTLSNKQEFTNLLPDTYSVKEDLTNLPNWKMTDLTCSGDGVKYDKDGQTVYVAISAGQDITCTYTNTKQAGISGYKFNDLNGNGVWDKDEPALSGWTIFIDENDNGILDNDELSYVTGGDGLYYFANLIPGGYSILEEMQTGWNQTVGVGDIKLDPGDELTDQNFGNQGRGSITVKKNVDTDGDGKVDVYGATDWTWDLSQDADYGTLPESDIATGSVRNVGAGTYTIHEDQKENYHFVSLECYDGQKKVEVNQNETSGVTAYSGSNIICTYTNARDTAQINVVKYVEPYTDGGKFDLLIDENVEAHAVQDNGTTGYVRVLTGNHVVSENGVYSTDLNDYFATIGGDCNYDGTITVEKDGEYVCTITNVKKAKVTVIKQAYPYDDLQAFDFTFKSVNDENECDDDNLLRLTIIDNCTESYDIGVYHDFKLDDNSDNTYSDTEVIDGLREGTYSVEEHYTDGWDLVNVFCSGLPVYDDIRESAVETENNYIMNPAYLKVSPGADITCYFTNVKHAKITIVKDAGPDSTQEFTFSHNIDRSGDFGLVDDGENPEKASKDFSDLSVGMYGKYYGITEHEVDGWRQADFSCDNWDNEYDLESLYDQSSQEGYDNYIYVGPGEEVTCTFTNEQTVLFLEKTNNRPNPTVVGDTVTYTLEVSIPEGAANLYDVRVIDLAPENFKYVHGSWTAMSSERGDLKTAGITTEPTYHSPGQWLLGDMVGGEVVTLTYQAVIQDIVSPGTYPDIAYAHGFTADEVTIFDNLSESDTPFVTTQVTVNKDIVPVVITQLAYTGNALYGYILVPMFMILLTLAGAQITRRNALKGGK